MRQRLDIPLESSYGNARLSADAQTVKDIFPNTRGGYRPYPGSTEHADLGTDAANDGVRGVLANGPLNRIWYVAGDTLYYIQSNYTTGSVSGTITGDSSDPIVMATDGNQLVFTDGIGNVWRSTGGGGASQITDVDLDNCYAVAYLDSRFIFEQPDDEWCVSEVDNASSIDSLDFATAEGFQGDTVAPVVANQMLYMMCVNHTEIWLSTGAGRPPYDRQAVIRRGLIGRHAYSVHEDSIFFIDDKRRPCVFVGQQVTELGLPSSIARLWLSYSGAKMSLARVQAYLFEQELFVDYSFYRSGGESLWTYHAPSGQWFEQSTDAEYVFNTDFSASGSTATGETYVITSPSGDGDLHSLDASDGSQYGVGSKDPTITLPILSGEAVGAPGVEMTLQTLSLNFAGNGFVTLSVSRDDGNTFTAVGGRASDNLRFLPYSGYGNVEYGGLGRFRNLLIRVELSSSGSNPVAKLSDVSAVLEPLWND